MRVTAERRAVRSVEEQQARVTAAAVAPRPVRVAIAEAQGLMCAEEVVTERPLPGFDQAAIDGYAVRSVDVLGVGQGDPSDDHGDDQADDAPRSLSAVEGSSPNGGVTLPVMGTIEAGARTPSRLQPGQAARVQTGAPMPTLADAVLPLRWTDGGQSRVRVLRGVRSGAYVRRTGDDVQPGDVAVRAGTIIGAAQVGLLAAVGRDRVLVHPRPRLSVLRWAASSSTSRARPAMDRSTTSTPTRWRPPARRGRGGEPGRHRQHRSQENSAKSSRVRSIAPRSW